MAQQRADDMAGLALAGIGLWWTPAQCTSAALVHEWRGTLHRGRMSQRPGSDILVGSSVNRPQISAEWTFIQDLLSDKRSYFDWLGEAIQESFSSVGGTAGELREAWLNALYWYYCGCTELSDPRAIICFTNALESLCDGHGQEAIVSMLEPLFSKGRDAVVWRNEQWSLEESVRQVYSVGRSESVHGGRFVLLREYRDIRALAAELTRLALLCLQSKLMEYELKYRREGSADRKATFLRWLQAR